MKKVDEGIDDILIFIIITMIIVWLFGLCPHFIVVNTLHRHGATSIAERKALLVQPPTITPEEHSRIYLEGFKVGYNDAIVK